MILEVLGAGGEGVVYRTLDTHRGEEIALKVLHLGDGVAVPQLKREFRFLRDLVHVNLLPLYELVVEREVSFFTMAYVRGRDFLQSASSIPSLTSLTLQLADVLSFLHQTGRVHRDIKPSNLIVRPNGELVLLDFGIGLDLRAKVPEVRTMVGTPRYMAPEILALQNASDKSDAYSMGILLYEALTGRHPQPSERTQLSQKSGFDPRDVAENIPEDFANLIRSLTEPDPEKRASVDLCSALLDRAVPSPRSPSQSAPQWDVRFSGRSRAISRLNAAKDWVKDGYSPFVVRIEAISGMGKSALVQHFLSEQPDSIVLSGRCSEHELLPHKAIDGVVVELIEHMKSRPIEEQLELVPHSDAAILAQLFPEFSTLACFEGALIEQASLGDYRALRHRAYLALAAVLARLANEQTLIVAIDDLQWGDVDSGRLIAEVFAGAERPNCLLILSYRSEEKESSDCIRDLFKEPTGFLLEVPGTQIQLEPLDDIEARALVAGLLEDEHAQLIEQIVHEAGGSPLLLTEMAAHLKLHGALENSGRGIEMLSEIVSSRLDALSAEARDAFGLLCCASAPTEVAHLAELTAGEPESLVSQLRRVRLGRSRKGSMIIEPIHDAVAETMRASLGKDVAGLHFRWAELLVEKKGDPAEVARHFNACGDSRTSLWAERAADQSAKSFALTSAIDLYRLALRTATEDEGRKFDLRLRLANMLADAGRGAEAAPIFERLAESAKLGDGIELRRRAAEQLLIIGDAQRGTRILKDVQEEVGLKWPRTNARALVSLLYHRALLNTMSDSTIERALSSSSSPELELKLAACRAAWPISMISTIHGAANCSLYLRLAIQSGDHSALSVGCAMEAMYQAISGPKNRAKVERWMASATRAAVDGGDVYREAFLEFAVGQIQYLCGDLHGSLEHFERSEGLFLEHGRGVAWELNSGRIFWTDALFYLGQHRRLDSLFSAWIPDAEARGDRYILSALKMAKAPRVLFKDGDVEGANTELHDGFALWDSPYVSYHHLSRAVIQAYVDIYRGAPEVALRNMPQLKKMMRQSYMDQVHVAQVQVGTVEALACLELAADTSNRTERSSILERVRRVAKMMARQQAVWSTALGAQFEALAELIEQPSERGLAQLAHAERLFKECRMVLHAAGASARLGELLGGDEGRTRLDRAHSAFIHADVGDWIRTLSCITPRVLPR